MPESNTRRPFSSFCSRAVEGIWLLAAAATPLVVNLFADAPYEHPKVYFVRGLAALLVFLMAAGGLMNRNALRELWRQPVVVAAAAVVLTLLSSTALSLDTTASMYGSAARGQGLLTHLAYFVFFLAVAVNLRTSTQVRRLLLAIVFGASIAALFGAAQRLGVDPLRVGQVVTRRAPSTAGNAIFFSAYAASALLLAIAGLASSRGRADRGRWAVAVVLCGAGFVAGASRGPGVGLIAGSAVMTWTLVAPRLGRWLRERWSPRELHLRLLLATAVLTLAAGLTGAYVIDRFDEGSLPRSGTVRVRLDAWEAVSRAMLAPQATAGVLSSPFADLRMLVGYGPEAAAYPLALHIASDLESLARQDELLDRAHNLPLQRLVESGVAGMAALFAVWFLVLRAGASRLGGGRPSLGVAALAVSGGLLLPWFAARSIAWSGLAATGAMLIVLAGYGILSLRNEPGRTALSGRVLVGGITAAVVCHVVETVSGIGVTPTFLMFWLLAGTLCSPWSRADEPDTAEPREFTSTSTIFGVAGAMVLAALPVPDLPDAGTATLDPRIVWVAIATVVVCALFASADADRWTGALRGTLVGGALPTLGVAAAVLAMRAAGAAYPSDLTRFSAMLALPALSGALGAMCVLTAAVRSGQPPRRARFAATVAVAVVALGATMLPTIRATSAGTGNSELRANRPDRAVTLFEAAVASRPDNPGRQIALSRARRVLAASPEINEIAVLDAAQGDLAASLARRPLVPGLHLEYAAVLTMRALRGTEDPIEALDRAIEHLRRAQALQPRAAETGMALQATIGLREALEQASGEPPSRNRRRP